MKILIAIANYGTKNNYYAQKLIDTYNEMKYETKIVVFSNTPKFFYENVEVKVGLPDKNPWSLPFGHKKLFYEKQDQFDLFIYTEDDTLIKEKNINAFLEVNEVLPPNETTGFLRYEKDDKDNIYYSTVHSHYHWEPGSVKRIGEYVFAFFTNEHSGCYIITQKQLKKAIASGGFLVDPHEGKYDLLCSAATDPYTQCGFKKMICISNIHDFTLHHMPNVYLGKMGLPQNQFMLQIETLLKLEGKNNINKKLFRTETKLDDPIWKKKYYEAYNEDIVENIPENTKKVLSIGAGWGATEKAIINKKINISVIPLDNIIASLLKVSGTNVLPPNFNKAFEEMNNEKFNVMILSNVIQYLHHPEEILEQLDAHLNDNGQIIIAYENINNFLLKIKILFGKYKINQTRNFNSTGINFMSYNEIRKCFLRKSFVHINSIFILHDKLKRWSSLMPKLFKVQLSTKVIISFKK